MIPWWLWILIITCFIVLAFFLVLSLPRLLTSTTEKIRRARYAREARIHNEKARQQRIQKDNYFGWPLPMTREGTLRISRFDKIHNPHRVSNLAVEKAYRDRALDLWIDLETMEELETGDLVIRWKPRKDRKPKEVY